MKDAPDIILFGGTFDPPHAGHQNCVRLAHAKFPKAKVLIVPAQVPATAGQVAKSPSLAFDERMTLCRLAFAELGAAVEVSDIERALPVPNYSLNTITELERRNPGASLGMLIGMDQFEHFLSWNEPLTIAAKVHLLVVGREENSENARSQFDQNLDMLKSAFKKKTGISALKQVYFLPGLTSAASSTTLRETLATGKEAPEGWLAPAVEDYIKKENIYSGETPS